MTSISAGQNGGYACCTGRTRRSFFVASKLRVLNISGLAGYGAASVTALSFVRYSNRLSGASKRSAALETNEAVQRLQ